LVDSVLPFFFVFSVMFFWFVCLYPVHGLLNSIKGPRAKQCTEAPTYTTKLNMHIQLLY
jgi:hypothetical protein